ncbi:MAG: hypothetical protein Q9P01_16345 [Anaerolineae bacterium]|nr:hypothetical protein [Anaerolineae bacterium]
MTEKPKHKKPTSRWKIGLIVLLAGCCGSLVVMVILGPMLPNLLFLDLYDSCETFITENVGIRIQTYSSDYWSGYQDYEMTRDGGESWGKFHTFFPDSGVWSGDCTNIGSINDELIYLIPTERTRRHAFRDP